MLFAGLYLKFLSTSSTQNYFQSHVFTLLAIHSQHSPRHPLPINQHVRQANKPYQINTAVNPSIDNSFQLQLMKMVIWALAILF
jgi:hypothetical protein